MKLHLQLPAGLMQKPDCVASKDGNVDVIEIQVSYASKPLQYTPKSVKITSILLFWYGRLTKKRYLVDSEPAKLLTTINTNIVEYTGNKFSWIQVNLT